MSESTLRTIISKLQNSSNDNYWPNDSMWVQFIKDHRASILEKSNRVELHPNDVRKFQYGIESYLTAYSYPKSIAWIVLWLNQLDSNLHFDTNITSIYIPDVQQIISLRSQYNTNKAYYKKTNGISEL